MNRNLLLGAFAASAVLATNSAHAATATEIDAKADTAIQRFYAQVPGGRALTDTAKGFLVFPSVVKAGFGIGGEYGTGVLRVGGHSTAYYSTTAASIGFQIGAQSKSILICFMTDAALASFRDSNGWEIGVDGSVALLDVGAGGSLDTTTAGKPVVGFVFGQSGLMANISLEGTKISKYKPD